MINFFSEETDFELPEPKKTEAWLLKILKNRGFRLSEYTDLNYIFCTDDYLHKMNIEYLDHDTLTDIITFDNSEEDDEIAADIFISIERVKENAADLALDFRDELNRVLAHGLLHLTGLRDKTEEEAGEMRKAENESLDMI